MHLKNYSFTPHLKILTNISTLSCNSPLESIEFCYEKNLCRGKKIKAIVMAKIEKDCIRSVKKLARVRTYSQHLIFSYVGTMRQFL